METEKPKYLLGGSAPFHQKIIMVGICLFCQYLWIDFAFKSWSLQPKMFDIVLGLVTGVLIADGMSTLVHFVLDNYFYPTTPIVGLMVFYFREHHDYPQEMFQRDWVENGWGENLLTITIGLLVYYTGLVSSAFGLCALATGMSLACHITAIHKASHTSKPPLFYKFGQKIGFFIDQRYHGTHHNNFSSHHSLVCGYVDTVVRALHILPVAESFIYLFLGEIAVNSTFGLAEPARPTFAGRFQHIKWVAWYTYFDDVSRRNDLDLHFMNWGYGNVEDMSHPVIPAPEYASSVLAKEPLLQPIDQTSLQLYLQLLSGLDMRDKSVVEYSSGKGGGIASLAASGLPSSCTGIDLCKGNIELCRRQYSTLVKDRKLAFVHGDACADLGFEPGSVDIVINVEASHCYPSRHMFYEQVFKILKPGGVFVTTDFFNSDKDRDDARESLSDLSFQPFEESGDRDITQHVLAAMRETDQPKRDLISQRVPWYLQPFFRRFAATRESIIWRGLQSGGIKYHMFRMIK